MTKKNVAKEKRTFSLMIVHYSLLMMDGDVTDGETVSESVR